MKPSSSSLIHSPYLLPFLFFFGRIILFLALVPKDLYGAGDLPVYFEWAGLPGLPFFDYWVEYPPVFAFLNAAIYRLAGGQEFLYDFLLVIIISLACTLSLVIFQQIAARLYGEQNAFWRSLIFFGLITPLSYTWWYYDALPLFLMLAALLALLKQEDTKTGWLIAAGMLTKWFPGFLLASVVRFRSLKRAIKPVLISLASIGAILAALLIASPRMAGASLLSQLGRTSWQTVWAIADGNYMTGAFVPLEERTNPAAATFPRGNPAVISSRLTLIPFALLGIWLFSRVRNRQPQSVIAFFGLTWLVFLLWSPGWSPQWILYLLPLILLTLPAEKGMLLSIVLIFLAIIEWPTLFTHNLWWGLWIVAPLRTIYFIILGVNWYKITRQPEPAAQLPL